MLIEEPSTNGRSGDDDAAEVVGRTNPPRKLRGPPKRTPERWMRVAGGCCCGSSPLSASSTSLGASSLPPAAEGGCNSELAPSAGLIPRTVSFVFNACSARCASANPRRAAAAPLGGVSQTVKAPAVVPPITARRIERTACWSLSCSSAPYRGAITAPEAMPWQFIAAYA